ncbi:MAG: S8 family serine peptidase [Ignavibacteriaceae bacterium]|nr:S8 family serine peptidase [Ignavibacteriaceae bacterium]
MNRIIVSILTFFLLNGTIQGTDLFIPDEIYIQFKNEPDVDSEGLFQLNPSVIALFSATPIIEIHSVFPKPELDNRLSGMERIYRIKVGNAENLDETLHLLSANSNVVYAERISVRRMFEIPNDPLWYSQYHLQLLKVDSARGIHTGNSSLAIAIIDGGVNYLHEDLRADIWFNTFEDLDGDGFLSPGDIDSIDNDNNGFIDDVIGWDFVNLPGQGWPGEDDSLADNEPMDFGGHGTHCAGDASAVTDNGLGIASVGGDCRIMCIRAGMTASNGFGYIYYSIEGIYYAAYNGAKVISMSYGGSGFSQTEQIAIDFAHSLGVICVAAAGNDNNNIPQYPANYNYVVAVAATDEQDHKAEFSNYGSWIDLCAPGVGILSTTVGGGYGNQGGTSMSTPIVAGLAGLTSAMFPQYTNIQVIDRMLTSCDDIDSLNPQYAGQLGAGRVNAYKTLDKVIRLYSFSISDSASGNNNGRLDYNETAGLVLTLKNTYDAVTNVNATVTSLNPILTITDSSSAFGNMSLGSISSNENDPFILTVGADTSIEFAPIKINITADGGYQYQKILELPIGQRNILIVNDDDPINSSKISYYTFALDSLQKSYDIWDVQTQGSPGNDESNYSTIIWYTGEAEQNVLTGAEQSFLENYFNNGGKLFLTGQNIAYDLVEQQNGLSFFENYLHASYIQNNSNDYSLQGLIGDPIGSGEVFIISGSGGANNQNSPDVVTAISPAQPAILYEAGNQTNQAALYYSGIYRLVYFAFGWEGINDLGPAKRVTVMQRVLNWLDQVSSIEDKGKYPISYHITLYPSYPNPFNPQTTIKFELPVTEDVELSVYNNLGQLVRNLLSEELTPGEYRIQWDGTNNFGEACSSGIYYLRLSTSKSILTQKMVLLK